MNTKTLGCLVAVLALAAVGCANTAQYNAVLLKEYTDQQEARKGLEAAIALVAERRYDEAAALLAPLAEAFEADGDPTRAAEATFWLAYCAEAQHRQAEAVRLYTLVAERYPKTPAARQATDRLSRLPFAR